MERKDLPGNEQAAKSVKRDRLWDFLMVQTVAAAAALLFVIAARAAGGDFYETVRQWYNDNFRETTTVDEVLAPDDGEKGTESENRDTGSDASEGGAPTASPTALRTERAVGGSEPVSSANALAIPVNGTVTSGFGYRVHPVNGGYLMHGGIDIAADTGTPIAAAWDGVVTEVAAGTSYGNYIIVKHTDSLSTLYAHCSEITADEGKIVKKGETVALVGSTGVSTGPHLHFEIRVNGEPIDPRSVLKTE